MRRRLTQRVSALALAPLVVSAVLAPAAAAHVWQNEGWTVYNPGGNCTWGRVKIEHGLYNEGGYIETLVRSHTTAAAPMNWACGAYLDRPARYLHIKQDLFVWSYHYNQWVVCNLGPWVENLRTAYVFWSGWNFNRHCGGGRYYWVRGGGYVENGPGPWHGGQMDSPEAHWVS